MSRPAVLAVRALGLGDFLTGVPALRGLRRAFPEHEIVLAAPAALAPLVPATGAVDRLLPAGELEPVAWPGPPPRVGVDLHGRGSLSHRVVARTRPERLVVFGGPTAPGWTGPRWLPGEHEVARWCRLLTESGIPSDPGDLRLAAPAGPVPGGLTGATVVHPGAAAASRRWPWRRYARLAAALGADGHRVVVTGGPDEVPSARAVAARAGLAPDAVLAGRTGLAALAALVAAARLVVSGDTGVAHLAVAFGVPSVTLCGPVPPAEWGPPPLPPHLTLWPAPAGYRGDPHGTEVDPVLAAIPVEAVLEAARRAPPTAGHM